MADFFLYLTLAVLGYCFFVLPVRRAWLFRRFIKAHGGTVEGLRSATIVLEELPFRISYRSQIVGWYRVTLSGDFDGVFSVTKRVSTQSGGIKTGSAAFDRDFVITSRVPEFAAGFFARIEIQQAVRALFKLGPRDLGLSCDGLTANWGWYNLTQYFDPLRPMEELFALLTLAKGLPLLSKGNAKERRREVYTRVWVFFLPLFLLATAFVLLQLSPFMLGIDHYFYSHLDSIGVFSAACGLVAAWLYAEYALSKFDPISSVQDRTRVYFSAFIGLPLTLLILVPMANILFDGSAETAHRVGIVQAWDAWEGSTHATTRCVVTVESWRTPHEQEFINTFVPVAQCPIDLGRDPKVMVVNTKAGALGFGWVTGYTIREAKMPSPGNNN